MSTSDMVKEMNFAISPNKSPAQYFVVASEGNDRLLSNA